MNFDEYQTLAGITAIYPNRGNNLIYPVLGLCGESGEVAEKVKKLIRDKNGIMTEEFKDLITLELGDILWYIASVCHEIGVDMNEVAIRNIKKLKDRSKNNTLHGSGDKRR